MKKRTIRVPTMREPFDDAVFSAYAALHGMERSAMPADVGKTGWNGLHHSDEREGIPEDMPSFVFTSPSKDVGGSLVIDLPTEGSRSTPRYGRLAHRAWVHVDADSIPSTIGQALIGRPIHDVVEVPGLRDWLMVGMHEEGGTMSLSIAPSAKGNAR